MKIDFLIANNLYDTTTTFAHGLIKALEKEGSEVRVLKISEDTFIDVAKQICKRAPNFTLSFSDITDGQGESLGNCIEIPHFTYMLDPAIYFLPHLQGKYSHVCCVDQGDVEFVKQVGFQNVSFLPHAVDASTVHYSEVPEYEVVFFGSCIDYKHLKLTDLMMEAANRVLTSQISILEALVELKVADEQLVASFHMVDHYVRGKEREQLVAAFANILIWGDGPWESYAPHATVNAPIPFDEVLEVMRLSKVVLNCSSRFKRGYHERIFNSLLVGTRVITAENPLLKDFPGVLSYTPGKWEQAIDLLDVRVDIEAGRQKVLDEHTWENRAKQILKVMSV